jgi:hypothetical protein
MKLSKSERNFLTTFVGIANKLLDSKTTRKKFGGKTRTRRSKVDVAKLKKQIRAARKRKVPVGQIADEFGVTPSYVYQLGK